MWRLIELANRGVVCDSLRGELEKEVAIGANAQVKADSVIEAGEKRLELEVKTSDILSRKVEVMDLMNKELKSEVRQQRRMTIAVAVVSVLTIIIML